MISLEDLKAYLGIAEDDTSEDARLTELERNAVQFIQSQTQRYFGPLELTTEIITGLGHKRLWLAEPPVEVSSGDPTAMVEEATYPGAEQTEYEEGVDFSVRYFGNIGGPDYQGFLMRLGSGTVWTIAYEYEVTYWRGYAEGDEPGDIRQLVLDMCSVKSTLVGREGFRSETAPDYSYVRFGEGDLDAVPGGRATLDAWKRLVYA